MPKGPANHRRDPHEGRKDGTLNTEMSPDRKERNPCLKKRFQGYKQTSNAWGPLLDGLIAAIDPGALHGHC